MSLRHSHSTADQDPRYRTEGATALPTGIAVMAEVVAPYGHPYRALWAPIGSVPILDPIVQHDPVTYLYSCA